MRVEAERESPMIAVPQFATQIRMVREANPGYDTTICITKPEQVIDVVRDLYAGLDREMVMVLALDTKHHVAARHVVSIGHLSGAPVHPREVMKVAILANAAAVVLVHNHPSGDTTPSGNDIAITHRLKQVCDIMGIDLLDHVIVDSEAEQFCSLREQGFLHPRPQANSLT